jgi:hypothetical protein
MISKWTDFRSGVRSQQNYLYELESLRSIAILLVILFHCWGISRGSGRASQGSSVPIDSAHAYRRPQGLFQAHLILEKASGINSKYLMVHCADNLKWC